MRYKPEQEQSIMANDQSKSTKQDVTGQETLKKWSKLMAQVWADDKLKQRLINKPTAVLREHGIETPPGVEIRVVENTDKVSYLTLWPKPAGDVTELTSSELEGVTGGLMMFSGCTGFCRCVKGKTDIYEDRE
jgi:hypothetical protein